MKKAMMKTMKKAMKRAAACAMTAVMTMSLAACGAKEAEASKETGTGSTAIRIGYVPVPNDAMIANVEGLYDHMGFEYELVEFASGKDVNNALASNSIDVGYLGTVPVATGIVNDMGYEVFWIDGIITGCECLAVKDGISSVEELGGATIGVVTGSTSHYSLISALNYYGVDPGSVTILNGAPAEIVAMWERGDLDAAYVWEPSLGSIVAAGGTKIFSGEDGEAIGATTAVVHVANKEFAEKNPEKISALVDVFVEAQELYKTSPDKVVKDVAAKLNADESLVATQIEGYRWLSREEQASDAYLGGGFAEILKKTADFLKEQSSISTSPEVTVFQEATTDEFVK